MRMRTLVDAVRTLKAPRPYYVGVLLFVLLLAALSIPSLNWTRRAAELKSSAAQPPVLQNEVSGRAYSRPAPTVKLSAFVQKAEIADQLPRAPIAVPDSGAGREIVRTASLEMVVQHPAEVADRITDLAENLGGDLVSADGGGQNATTALVTVRVPAAQFEMAREEIRKLGL
jgi:hypothetical protein